jgi:hypothetical protein
VSNTRWNSALRRRRRSGVSALNDIWAEDTDPAWRGITEKPRP